MPANAASQATEAAETARLEAHRFPPFENGDRMDQATFHRRYRRMPEDVKAELLGGIVSMASPVSIEHGTLDHTIGLWFGTYAVRTPGLRAAANATIILGTKDEPQPDQCLFIEARRGGRSRIERIVGEKSSYLFGPPEMVAEIAASSRSRDLHLKRRRYYLAGVEEYLVLLPRGRRAWWFVRGESAFAAMPADADGVFRSRLFPGLWLDAAALFAEDAAALLAMLEKGLATPEHATFVAALAASAPPA